MFCVADLLPAAPEPVKSGPQDGQPDLFSETE